MSAFFALIVVVASIVHLLIRRKSLTRSSVVDILSLYAFAIFVGLSGVFAGFGHLFNGPLIANQIGWEAGSPFQTEVGICNIAFGILGFLSLIILCKLTFVFSRSFRISGLFLSIFS